MGKTIEEKIQSLPEDIREISLKSMPNPHRPYTEDPEISNAINELKKEWLLDVLDYLGLSEDECINYDAPETHEKMKSLYLEVFDTPHGELIVKQTRSVVGEWSAPEIIIVPPSGSNGPAAHLKLKYWSVVDLDESN